MLNDRLFDMGQEDPEELELLKYTPSSALGSCRYKMADPDVDDTDYKRILEIFQKYDVRYFFYNGGNDSMDTCNKISKYMQKVGYECRVMGVPKTIDNDLYGTDHCPGFASAAKYIATSCMEVYQDAHVYDTGMIAVIEIMGRHAGWLAGAAALAAALRLRPRPGLPARGGLRHGPVPGRRQARSTRRRATAWWPCPRASTTPTAPSSPRPRPPPPTASATPSWAAWPPCWPTWSKEETGAKVRGIELISAPALRRPPGLRDRHRGGLSWPARPPWRPPWTASPTRWWPSSCTREGGELRLRDQAGCP